MRLPSMIIGALGALGALGVLMLALPACGGLVEIGSSQGGDAGGGGAADGASPSPSSSSSGEPGTAPVVNCPAPLAAPEVLLDVAQTMGGGGTISDFVGNGERIYVGLNLIANFQAGRILDLPHREGGNDEIANISPNNVTQLGLALNRIYFGTDAVVGLAQLAAVPTSGGDVESRDRPAPGALATHPSQLEAYFDDAVGHGAEKMSRWQPGQGAAQHLAVDGHITSIATNGQTIVTLVENRFSETPEYRLVRTPSTGSWALAGEVIVTIPGTVTSNVAVDATHAYFTVSDPPVAAPLGGHLYRVPLNATGLTLALAHRLQPHQFSMPSAGQAMTVEVDASNVYVENSCATCVVPTVEIWRGSASGIGLLKVIKTFPPLSGRVRPFNVDACLFYWQDGGKLWRQSKSTL